MGVPSDHWDGYEPPVTFTPVQLSKFVLKITKSATKAERKRNIELLGTIVVDREGFLNYTEAVALIKGEQK